MTQHIINVAKDFSRFPSGRYVEDSRFSGQRFRDDFLVPSLKNFDRVVVELDGTLGYGSSFLDEAFGGLRRANIFPPEQIKDKLVVHTANSILKSEISQFLT
jgi:hypothetical protein